MSWALKGTGLVGRGGEEFRAEVCVVFVQGCRGDQGDRSHRGKVGPDNIYESN